MGQLVRDGVVLGYDDVGQGDPALVFVHGAACHRGFWAAQVEYFGRDRRVLTVDLRGHGGSDAPAQAYTIRGFADDLAWACAQVKLKRPVVVGHSLGGLVALELAATYPEHLSAAVLLDSVLLPAPDRVALVRRLVTSLRGPDPDRALRDYFATLFGPDDRPSHVEWILDQAMRTAPHVTSSLWEESLRSWNDADALQRCQVPLLYLDAGTPNADLERAAALNPQLMIGRTIGSGHFNQLEVPEQVNAMLMRFLTCRFTD